MAPTSSPRRVNGAVALLRSSWPWRRVPSGDKPEWLATAALAAARAGSEPELAKCLEAIGADSGGPGFPAMILMWTDMLVDATGPAGRDDLAQLDDVIYTPGYNPADRWANLLAAARVKGDDRVCEALLAGIPQGQAAGYARTYVSLIAAAFNGIAVAIRAAAEQGDPGAQEWAALMRGQGERQDVQIVMHARHEGRDVQVLGVRPTDYATCCIVYDDTGEHAHIPAGELKSADDYSTNAAADDVTSAARRPAPATTADSTVNFPEEAGANAQPGRHPRPEAGLRGTRAVETNGDPGKDPDRNHSAAARLTGGPDFTGGLSKGVQAPSAPAGTPPGAGKPNGTTRGRTL